MTKTAIVLSLGLIGTLAARDAWADPTPVDGGAVFAARCAKCHGDSGKGDTAEARALKVRPLIDDSALARMTPEEIARAVRSNAKHQGFEALDGLNDGDLQAAAVFVKALAKKR